MDGQNKAPFFIVGCPRSGTSLTHKLLTRRPGLTAPRETQFYRWADGFGSPSYRSVYSRPPFPAHRKVDKVPEEEFWQLFDRAKDRRELMTGYIEIFRKYNTKKTARWFDKSPQNIYGLSLLRQDFPDSPIVFVVRNPLNVVASMRIGKHVHVPDHRKAAAFWIEAIRLMDDFRDRYEAQSYVLYYERLLEAPLEEMRKVLMWLGENTDNIDVNGVEPEENKYRTVLTPEEVTDVEEMCVSLAQTLGYASLRSDAA